MYISELELKNFRAYKGCVNISFKNNLVYITGENNVGKTTIFDAIYLLLNGTTRQFLEEENKNKMAKDKHTSISITFAGDDISSIISQFVTDTRKRDVFLEYVYHKGDDKEYFSIGRSDEVTIWENSTGREYETDPGALCVYNAEADRFENPSGIEKPLQAMFNCVRVDANSSVENETRNIKKILLDLASNFEDNNQYKKFKEVHEETFNVLNDTLVKDFTNRLSSILKFQYDPSIETNINFYLPSIDNFLSNFEILINDGVETEYCYKGHGLQRSVALALIQVAAEFQNKVKKPTFYLIDEPEVYLHPCGQHQLRDSLEKLSNERTQVFVATHSTYILDRFNGDDQDIIVLNRDVKFIPKITDKSNELGRLFTNPTPSEITYIAFNIPSFEFHNELFNCIQTMDSEQEKSVKTVDNILKHYNRFTDNLLVQSGFTRNDGLEVTYSTLPTKIRNAYHHGNVRELDISEDLLRECIELMRNYIKENKNN